MVDKSVDLLKLFKGDEKGTGLRIAKAVTAEPDPLTFIFEGTKRAIDPEIFEIPINLYPIKKGDRFISYPILGTGAASRWALIQKINGCMVNLATMQGPTSLIIDGIAKTYTAGDLVLPSGLLEGDRVAVAAVYDSGQVKYAVLNKMT